MGCFSDMSPCSATVYTALPFRSLCLLKASRPPFASSQAECSSTVSMALPSIVKYERRFTSSESQRISQGCFRVLPTSLVILCSVEPHYTTRILHSRDSRWCVLEEYNTGPVSKSHSPVWGDGSIQVSVTEAQSCKCSQSKENKQCKHRKSMIQLFLRTGVKN